MNCEQCQELISVYLDNELETQVSTQVQMHLAICASCAKVCEDFAVILDFCETEDFLPPNSKALWCRINNIIETEVKTEFQQQNSHQRQATEKGLFARVRRNPWHFSFSQVISLILCIALISSLLTVIGVKNFSPAGQGFASDSSASVFEKVLSKFGLLETPQQTRERRIRQQHATIEYWNQRVEMRRASWELHLRDAFDRNLREIDQVVTEYDKILRENPQDELSGEMLDSALNEKVELLREFSEL